MIELAVVLAGGLGTRLGALTRQTPKPMLDVAGRPFILRLIDELRRQDVGEILILAGFRADRLLEVVGRLPDVRVLVEPEPLGTGGALRFASAALADRFFFLNGDSLFDINLWTLAAGARSEHLATLALRQLDDVARYGAAILEGDRIRQFAASTDRSGPGVINGGVGVLSRQILDYLPAAGPVSIETQVYPRLAADGLLGGVVFDRPFIDIGVPDDFALSQSFLPSLQDRKAVRIEGPFLQHLANSSIRARLASAIRRVNDFGWLALVDDNACATAANLWLKPYGAHLDSATIVSSSRVVLTCRIEHLAQRLPESLGDW